jgi:hypothetical protein
MTLRVRILASLLILCTCGVLPLEAQDQPMKTEKGALLRTIVLPGWGQYYLGDHRIARRMMTTEVCFWLLLGTFKRAENWFEQDFRSFATLHAGTSYRLKPDIYYYRLGRYDSIEDYNQAQQRDRNIDAIYPLNTDMDWDWDSPYSRKRFQDLRRASLRTAKAASFTVGGMVVNRAIAAIHVLFLSRSDDDITEIHLDPLPRGGIVHLGFSF